jgi:hypothetical protein
VQRVGALDLASTKQLCNMYAQRAGVWIAPVGVSSTPPGLPHSQNSGGTPSHSQLHIKSPHSSTENGPPPGSPASVQSTSSYRSGTSYQPGSSYTGGQPPQSMYRPPFKNVENVIVGIPFSGDIFYLRKRLAYLRL